MQHMHSIPPTPLEHAAAHVASRKEAGAFDRNAATSCGFTLIEVLMVIAIMLVLLAVSVEGAPRTTQLGHLPVDNE